MEAWKSTQRVQGPARPEIAVHMRDVKKSFRNPAGVVRKNYCDSETGGPNRPANCSKGTFPATLGARRRGWASRKKL